MINIMQEKKTITKEKKREKYHKQPEIIEYVDTNYKHGHTQACPVANCKKL